MANPSREAIETFMSITGATEAVAVQKLEDNNGDLNEAVNAHFSEGDRTTALRSSVNERSVTAPHDDLMDIDNPEHEIRRGSPFSLLSASRTLNPSSLLDPNVSRSSLDGSSDFTSRAPFATHPREVRQIPIEVKDGSETSGHSRHAPLIEEVTDTANAHGPSVQGTVIIDDGEEEDIATGPRSYTSQPNEHNDVGHTSQPSAPIYDDLPGDGNDIEEEMVRAAIEASKKETEQGFDEHNDLSNLRPHGGQASLDDAELARAVSLSIKTAEQEKALRQQAEKVGTSNVGTSGPSVEEVGKGGASNGRLNAGVSSHDESEDEEVQPLTRNRPKHAPSSSLEAGVIEVSPTSSPRQENLDNDPPHNTNAFPSDEWGGISSEEHDEAVMLEAAMFGGIPERPGYLYPYAPHQFIQSERSYPRRTPRPPSPTLEAQRLIREQQDDEYLASLQADQEKELRARAEAEARRLQEEAAREAAVEKERQRLEENRRKLEEQEELERQLAAKEASLPEEPSADNENAVTLLVRMPDGSRRGRRFLKSDKLQLLFDFIDIGKVVKPGTYRVVRPYPRRAFGDGEGALTLNELGLTSKQEALFLELI